jgi:hypothetical protein
MGALVWCGSVIGEGLVVCISCGRGRGLMGWARSGWEQGRRRHEFVACAVELHCSMNLRGSREKCVYVILHGSIISHISTISKTEYLPLIESTD